MGPAPRFCVGATLLLLLWGGISVSPSMAQKPPGQGLAPKPEVGVSIEESGSTPQFAAYYEQFAAEVRRRWQIPTGNVPLKLRLQGYMTHLGEAQDVEVVETTGVPVVDQAAIEAFEQAALAKPLPSVIPGDRQFIRLTMVTSPSDVDAAKPAKAVNFDPFLADLNKRVYKHWFPQARPNQRKKAVFKLTVGHDGTLKQVQVEESFGSEEADAEAIAAFKKASPYSPLPSDYTAENLTVDFELSYDINTKVVDDKPRNPAPKRPKPRKIVKGKR